MIGCGKDEGLESKFLVGPKLGDIFTKDVFATSYVHVVKMVLRCRKYIVKS